MFTFLALSLVIHQELSLTSQQPSTVLSRLHQSNLHEARMADAAIEKGSPLIRRYATRVAADHRLLDKLIRNIAFETEVGTQELAVIRLNDFTFEEASMEELGRRHGVEFDWVYIENVHKDHERMRQMLSSSQIYAHMHYPHSSLMGKALTLFHQHEKLLAIVSEQLEKQ